MKFDIMLAVIVAALSVWFLMVRYVLANTKSASAGVALLAAVAFIWRILTGRPDAPEDPAKPEPETPTPPTPPTRDVDEIIHQSGKQLSAEPPDDIHERLRNEIERQRREYGD